MAVLHVVGCFAAAEVLRVKVVECHAECAVDLFGCHHVAAARAADGQLLAEQIRFGLNAGGGRDKLLENARIDHEHGAQLGISVPFKLTEAVDGIDTDRGIGHTEFNIAALDEQNVLAGTGGCLCRIAAEVCFVPELCKDRGNSVISAAGGTAADNIVASCSSGRLRLRGFRLRISSSIRLVGWGTCCAGGHADDQQQNEQNGKQFFHVSFSFGFLIIQTGFPPI